MNGHDVETDDGPIFDEFSDPRLVEIYDTVNPIGEYEAFYLDLAAKLSAETIVDIGCGTGLLTCEWVQRGHRLIGVEPSNARTPGPSRRSVDDEVVGPVVVWFQDLEVEGDLARYEIHYLFARSGEE